MSIKINGKPFDFDSQELYAGERPDRKLPLLEMILWMLALSLFSYGLYPWIVKALALIFTPITSLFGITV